MTLRREQSKECIEISVREIIKEDLKLRGFNIHRRAELVEESLNDDVYSKKGIGARGASKVSDGERRECMVSEVKALVNLLPKEFFSCVNGSPLHTIKHNLESRREKVEEADVYI